MLQPSGEPSAAKLGLMDESIVSVYSWANELASESRRWEWVAGWYVWPSEVLQIMRQLQFMRGGIVGLVGPQGVGKSSALLAICVRRNIDERKALEALSKSLGKDISIKESCDMILMRWRRQPELFTSLLDGTHELTSEFLLQYKKDLLRELQSRFPHLDLEQAKNSPENLDPVSAEKMLGKARSSGLRHVRWLELLAGKKTILIDTPDYSKTDRRAMAKDLEEIYWLWSSVLSFQRCNVVVAIQKEMFRDHFFFDKMHKVELKPLEPKQMIEAYVRRFETTDPFSEEALLALARMSRGIFRRFLRYIMLVLDLWQTRPEPIKPIDPQTVREAIPLERLAEDMELELVELFPKHSDLRKQAVRLLMLLEESGPQKQSQVAEELGLEEYAVSRLLAKLELHHYVIREREGTDKIVKTARRE